MALKKSKRPKPTEAELTILKALWQLGPSTVRELWEQISPDQQTGYTTVLKLLQIMLEKGLVKRNDSARTHVYEAAASEEQTQRQVVRHVLERMFAGSARKLVMQALEVKRASPAELNEIRKLLDELERDQK
jgi:predicted transcriptional regulator